MQGNVNNDNRTKVSVADLEKRSRAKSRTDMARLRRVTEAELEEKIATDPDWNSVPADWHLKAEAIVQNQKKLLSLRVDADVPDWFKSQGPGIRRA